MSASSNQGGNGKNKIQFENSAFIVSSFCLALISHLMCADLCLCVIVCVCVCVCARKSVGLDNIVKKMEILAKII